MPWRPFCLKPPHVHGDVETLLSPRHHYSPNRWKFCGNDFEFRCKLHILVHILFYFTHYSRPPTGRNLATAIGFLLLAPLTPPAFCHAITCKAAAAVSVFPTVKIPKQTAFAAQTWRLWQHLFRASHGWFALTNCKLFLLHLAPVTLWKWWCLITSCNDMASRDDAVSSHLPGFFCFLFLF